MACSAPNQQYCICFIVSFISFYFIGKLMRYTPKYTESVKQSNVYFALLCDCNNAKIRDRPTNRRMNENENETKAKILNPEFQFGFLEIECTFEVN